MSRQKRVADNLFLAASPIPLSRPVDLVADEDVADEDVGELVPDPQVCREFQITSMTLWRWDHDPELEFPPPIGIRKRKFRRRSALEIFKRQLVRNAIARRTAA
jgi:hypothetical protein